MKLKPFVGLIVLYALTAADAAAINSARNDARKRTTCDAFPLGSQRHEGNEVKDGEIVSGIIVNAWAFQPDSAVNLKLFLDGNDDFWATSRSQGDEKTPGTWFAVPEGANAGAGSPGPDTATADTTNGEIVTIEGAGGGGEAPPASEGGGDSSPDSGGSEGAASDQGGSESGSGQ